MGTFVLAAVLGYGAIAGAMYLWQDRMVFLPGVAGRAVLVTPQSVGLEHEEVSIRTGDGERLHGWLIPAASAHRLLLFFHGNAGNISHRLDSIALFQGLGLNVLIVDYRGYGQSTGKPSEPGMYRDVEAVWDYATTERGFPPSDIIVFGRSLGGSVAAWLSARRQPAALIVESTFTSAPDLAAELYWWLPARLLTRLRFDTRAQLKQIQCPVLIIHSRDDDLISFSHAQALIAAASSPKRLLAIRGDHNSGFLESGETYVSGLRFFLAELPP